MPPSDAGSVGEPSVGSAVNGVSSELIAAASARIFRASSAILLGMDLPMSAVSVP